MANASKLSSCILRRLAVVKNHHVAESTGIDETFLSRFTHGERGLRIDQLEPFFAALGLAVIECDGDLVTMPKKRADSLAYLAAEAINRSMSDE